MSSKFLEELSNDYEKLFETEIGYDVIIYAGDELNVKEIHAHSNILCIRSKYFRTAFSNEWAEKKDGKFILKKPNISPHLFDIILRNCDNKGATIWVAKIQGSTQLIGGYNPLDWNGHGYVKKPNEAIYCYNSQGPHMGGFLCYGNNKWRNQDNNATYYPDIGIIPAFNFEVENYEVFQVVKK
ncbi:unnamed protein product [Rhizophagus irregularis]|nr:unnamed protein product [Rhizophagus irregularis]